MYLSSTNHVYNPAQSEKSEKLDKLRDFIQKHRALTFIIICVVFLLIFVPIILLINKSLPEQQQPEKTPYPYFTHRYLIDYTIGDYLASDVYENIGNVIVSTEEIDTAPDPDNNVIEDTGTSEPEIAYEVVIEESSYRTLQTSPDFIYKMNLNISDGRIYTLYLRVDEDYGKQYLVAVLDRIDSDITPDHAFIYTNDEAEALKSVSSWIESLKLNSLIIDILPLATYPY